MRRRPFWHREAKAVALQAKLIARRQLAQRGVLAPRPKRAPVPARAGHVVFVHGFMAAGPVFDPLRERVEASLGVPTHDLSYGSLQRFEDIAAGLAALIESQVPAEEPVSLVGHSLGGLVSRWYIQKLGGRRRVDRLVTLATPHGGTRSAKFAPGPLGVVLKPESDVLRALGPSVGLPHVAVVAGEDRMVTPPKSAGQVDGAEVVWMDDVGHNGILYDERVHRVVLSALSEGVSAGE